MLRTVSDLISNEEVPFKRVYLLCRPLHWRNRLIKEISAITYSMNGWNYFLRSIRGQHRSNIRFSINRGTLLYCEIEKFNSLNRNCFIFLFGFVPINKGTPWKLSQMCWYILSYLVYLTRVDQCCHKETPRFISVSRCLFRDDYYCIFVVVFLVFDYFTFFLNILMSWLILIKLTYYLHVCLKIKKLANICNLYL